MTMTAKQHESALMDALSASNRADFEAHYPAKEATVQNLYDFYMQFNGGQECYANQD